MARDKLKNLLVVVFVMILITGCFGRGSENDETTPTKIVTQTSEGVVLHGCTGDSGYLENTRSDPVRIRRVWYYSGERTQSIDLLEPDGKLTIEHISHQHGFYIYTIDGVLVGFISGDCPD